MILAPTLTLHTPAGSRLDADAAAFAAASGATDVAALSEFVKGVKALGLWNSMVCWPLRSSQNAGTGTTAYSLGGLGTFNGTLVNGPAWGADGLTFNGTNQVVTAQPTTDTNSQFFGLVHNNTTTTGNSAMSVSTSIASQTELRFREQGDLQIHSAASWSLTSVNGSFSRSGFAFYLAAWNSALSQVFVQQNSTARTAVSRTYTGTTDNALRIMSGPSTQFVAGTTAFAFFSKQQVSSSTSTAFYTLYKQTLGAGLGLP
jgi:hypothetical protein